MAVSSSLDSAPSSVKEVRSVRNACAVLEAVAAFQPIGVSELARATGIDKSAVQRIAVTLHAAGWLHPHNEPPTRWEISPANPVLRLATGDSLATVGRPAMEKLRELTGETVILVTRNQGQLVIVAAAESPQPVRVSPTVGLVLPYDGSSTGAAIAAWLPEAELRPLQAAHPALHDRRLDRVRQRGWADLDQELGPGVRAVAAAVAAPDGYPLGAMAVCGPANRISASDLPRLGAMVVEAAGQVLSRRPESPR